MEIIDGMGSSATGVHFRLGLNDIEQNGDYRWVSDNSVADYTNFNSCKITADNYLYNSKQ